MLREHQHLAVAEDVGEGLAPGHARRGFRAQPGAAVDGDATHRERHAQGRAGVRAVGGPGVGVGVQSVVHVHGAQAVCPLQRIGRQPVQQHGGIEPTAEGHADRARGVGGGGDQRELGGRGHGTMLAVAVGAVPRCTPGF